MALPNGAYRDEIGQVLALSNAVEHALGWVIRMIGSLVDSMAIISFGTTHHLILIEEFMREAFIRICLH